MKIEYLLGYTTIELEDDLGTSINLGNGRVIISQDNPDEPKGYESIKLTRELVEMIKGIDLS